MMQVPRTEILQSQLEIREQAFRYFTEQIHDNIGQSLSAVAINLYQLGNNCHEERTLAILSQNAEMLNAAIHDLRLATHGLSLHDPADTSLMEALSKEIEFLSDRRKLNCSVDILGIPVEYAPEHHVLIFRSIQQAVHISLDYAKATAVSIKLQYGPRKLDVSLYDNGNKLNTEALANDTAIARMHMRCLLLRGTFNISHRDTQGNVISIAIPHTI